MAVWSQCPGKSLISKSRLRALLVLAAPAFAWNAMEALALGWSSRPHLRVVSYNIKGFGSGFVPAAKPQDEVLEAYRLILEDLRRLQPDVLCLNEVVRFALPGDARDSLEALAQDLGDFQAFFAHATPGYESFGNAVLVNQKLEVLGSRSAHLEGGSVVLTKAGQSKKIVRSALAVQLKAPQNSGTTCSLAVLTTHLDHLSADARVTQATSLCSLAEELTAGLPHVLLGDLNALKDSDYNQQEWAAVQARHDEKSWSSPQSCPSLRVFAEAGYEDLLELRFREVAQSLKEVPAPLKLTAPAEAPLIRIDYALMSSGLTEALKLKHPPPAFVDSGATGSDHLPICVELPS